MNKWSLKLEAVPAPQKCSWVAARLILINGIEGILQHLLVAGGIGTKQVLKFLAVWYANRSAESPSATRRAADPAILQVNAPVGICVCGGEGSGNLTLVRAGCSDGKAAFRELRCIGFVAFCSFASSSKNALIHREAHSMCASKGRLVLIT